MHSYIRDPAWQGQSGLEQPTEARTRRIDIGLVNNMPDSALEQTEQLFFRRLEAAAHDMSVNLRLFTLPGVIRSESAKRHLGRFYSDIGELFDVPLDALIVTGTEPVAADLRDEPYWRSLTEVLDWAEDTTASTMLSCLAAHAAVLHFDDIVRRPLNKKCFGVFDHFNVAAHPLARGVPLRLSMPHSRWNDLDEDALRSSGYEVIYRSPDVGLGLFIKQKKSLFIFFQGHPEYDPDTLLREYRRDIRRYLKRQCENYPSIPHGYFNTATSEVLANFRDRAQIHRHEDLIVEFPTMVIQENGKDRWRRPANCIFRNWLLHVYAAKRQQNDPARMMLSG
jgi:homoserine O-succinyltransferase/O-acetyltransferase